MPIFSLLINAQGEAAPDTPAVRFSIDPLVNEAVRAGQDILTRPPEALALSVGLSAAVVIGAWLFLWTLRRLLDWAAKRLSPDDAAEADGPQRKRAKIGGAALAVARIAVLLTAIVLILYAWGVDVAAMSGGLLGPFFGVAWRLALILVLAFAAMEIANYAVGNVISRAADRANEVRRAAQLRTVQPVLIALLDGLVVVIAGLMLLSEIGVDVGPLIAGAGIVGLAVGFGAQTVVKDFITGLFLILEDIVSIGDVANIQGKGGVVESMTLRTIRLRGFDGTLHVFPYGEAQVIQNLTKDFSYYVFDLSIAYSADINKALAVMQETGDKLKDDPEFSPLIMAPIEVVGVDALADSGVVLKARIKTYPIKQWTVGREYLKRIKLAFDAAGIEIPFPHLKLVAPDETIPVHETTNKTQAG